MGSEEGQELCIDTYGRAFSWGVGRGQMEELELPMYGTKARLVDDSVAPEGARALALMLKCH